MLHDLHFCEIWVVLALWQAIQPNEEFLCSNFKAAFYAGRAESVSSPCFSDVEGNAQWRMYLEVLQS